MPTHGKRSEAGSILLSYLQSWLQGTAQMSCIPVMRGGAIFPKCGLGVWRGRSQLSPERLGQLSCCIVFNQGQGDLYQGQRRARLAESSPRVSTCVSPMTPCANASPGHHHRPQLQQDHKPRHGLWQQLRPGCHHGPSGSTGHPNQ